MQEPEKPMSSVNYLGKGFGYASTSLLALYSGYLLGAKPPVISSLILLLAPLFLSVPFFVIHQIHFGSSGGRTGRNEIVYRFDRKEGVVNTAIITGLLSVIICILYFALFHSFNPRLVAAIAMYGSLFWGYGFFLYRRSPESLGFAVRHQLVWPSILSISFPLYFGLNFRSVFTSIDLFWPVAVLLVGVFLSEWLLKSFKMRTVCGVVLYFIAFGMSIFRDQTSNYLSSFLACIGIAAYLAVFESWRITSDIAIEESTTGNPRSTGTSAPRSDRFYKSTLIGLIISGSVVPFIYIFTNYTSVFLTCFGFHAGIAFFLWYRAGHDQYRLTGGRWGYLKTVYGFLFLGTLVLDSFMEAEPRSRLMAGFVSFSGFGVLVAILALGLAVLAIMAALLGPERFRAKFDALLKGRSRYLLFVPFISLFMCLLIIVLQSLDLHPTLEYKGDRAYILYSSMFVVSLGFLASLFRGGSPGGTPADRDHDREEVAVDRAGGSPASQPSSPAGPKVVRSIAGVLVLTRASTSMLVGLTVFIPCVIQEILLSAAILSSLPFVLAAAGGFALNDFFDVERDRISKPFRAIPRQLVSKQEALVIGVCLVILGVVIAVAATRSFQLLCIQLLALIGVVGYNYVIKRVPYAKTLVAAFLCILPLVFLVVRLRSEPIMLAFPLAALIFIFGRELLMDIIDVEGDVATGLGTLPSVIGEKKATVLAFSAIITGCTLVFALSWLRGSEIGLKFSLASMIAAILLLVSWIQLPNVQRRNIVRLLWIPMLIGLGTLV